MAAATRRVSFSCSKFLKRSRHSTSKPTAEVQVVPRLHYKHRYFTHEPLASVLVSVPEQTRVKQLTRRHESHYFVHTVEIPTRETAGNMGTWGLGHIGKIMYIGHRVTLQQLVQIRSIHYNYRGPFPRVFVHPTLSLSSGSLPLPHRKNQQTKSMQ